VVCGTRQSGFPTSERDRIGRNRTLIIEKVNGKRIMTEIVEKLQSMTVVSPGSRPRFGASGVLLLDKPANISSFAAISQLKRLLNAERVGHCGTLDPFATGLLLVCLNQATRIVDQLLVQDKVYRFTMHLGVETNTLDRTGAICRRYDGKPPDEASLKQVAAVFRGRYLQQAPKYSAIKVRGRRLYEWTRQGIDMETPVRPVLIHRLELENYEWPEAVFEVHCSKGTYVRQLAADIGEKLSCGGHVSQLRRLTSGRFNIDQATTLGELKGISEDSNWRSKLLSLNEALSHLPECIMGSPAVPAFLQGGHLDADWEAHQRLALGINRQGPVRLVNGEGRLLALWWPYAQAGERRLRVFSSSEE
jgi:tRNA pseudouridine55 synthase